MLMVGVLACEPEVEPFGAQHVDRSVGVSALPTAVMPESVGTYPGRTKSGAGYFYDDVLEYRVWMHPEEGADDLAGGADYFAAFAYYEAALRYSERISGAEEPLVLVRQREWIDEPDSGRFVWKRGDRNTEWKPEWLEGSKRDTASIREFLNRSQPVP